VTTYYMLADAARLPLPARITGYLDDELAAADPRCLYPSEVIDDDIEAALLAGQYRLIHLEPRGTVTTDDDGEPACADGWNVVLADPDLSAMLGPQAAQVMAVITEAERSIAGGDYSLTDAYTDAVNAVYDSGYPEAEQAAADALDAIGADEFWWGCIGSCVYGGEVIALAARDLIGTVPGWTQDAYDLLTRPWLTATGKPAHPGDAVTCRA
jgi:hypothetical protein